MTHHAAWLQGAFSPLMQNRIIDKQPAPLYKPLFKFAVSCLILP
jgi:hypothetical protein